MVGWRGEPGTKDEPQHVKQGEVTLSLLNAMGIPYTIIDSDETIAKEEFCKLINDIKSKGYPHAAIIRKNIFASYKLKNRTENDFEMSREEAMKIVLDSLGEEDVVISTTGKLSRELFEYREQKNQGHSKDFLTVGSMGHSSSIALGVALNAPKKQVYCLDGDGAMIMHMGSITNVGVLGVENYKHIVFNNGAHESVGGQPTIALQLNLPQIALSCGYKSAKTISNKKELEEMLKNFELEKGPALLEIKVNTKSRDDLGRPTRTTFENKEDFMQNILG
jgi:phosphonopyruvate decarboxylase